VHIFFPGTIYSPGYVEENKTKPKITLKIEESDEGMQPDLVAEALLRGKHLFRNRTVLISGPGK
jgi:3-dehydrosphinganine reductase